MNTKKAAMFGMNFLENIHQWQVFDESKLRQNCKCNDLIALFNLV